MIDSVSMTCEMEDTSGHGEELTEVDIADASNGCVTEIRENGLLLWPVMPQEGGEGLPYAPVNWPLNGDIWGWRVGRRVATTGFYLDRYLYLPLRFQKSRRKRDGFASKLSVEQYVRARFPDSDVNAFFSSFSWKIPSQQAYLMKDEHGSFHLSSEEMVEQSPSFLLPGVGCKAGNMFCSSLTEADQMSHATKPVQTCDVCCSEPGFCRECCCILCCKTVDLGCGGYSFIRCEATVDNNFICGHVAHINCALRCYMAGTVGGSIGLDTEYYCRRCDSRSSLTNHVMSLLKTCESTASREDIEKMLNAGVCLLRGSQKKDSQRLLNHIESILQKVKGGGDLDDVWKVESGIVPVPTGQMDHDISPCRDMLYQNECLNLEVEILQVLEMLKSAQRVEFRIAKDRLSTQKDLICSLYRQLDKEKTELEWPTPKTDCDALLRSVASWEEHLERELRKLRDMEKVASGYGNTPKQIIKEYFVEERFDFNLND